MNRRRNKKQPPGPEVPPQGTSGKGLKIALIVVGLLLGACLVFSGIAQVQQSTAAKETQKVIDELGGKTTHYRYDDVKWSFGKIDFAGKPFTDAELTRLGASLRTSEGPRELDLRKTPITDAGLEGLRGVKKICVVWLDETQVAGPGLRHLDLGSREYIEKHEVLISLARTPIDDAGLENLLHLKELQVLNLTGTRVQGAGLGKLHALKKLHRVTLTDCPMNDDSLTVLDGWKTLYTLDLGGTKITDEGLPRIARVKQLQTLSLARTAVTDRGLARLDGLKNLESLSLEDTAITDAALPTLGSVVRLKDLSLNGTKVTDAGLRALATWDELTSLHLQRTGITDEGLIDLQAVPKLKRVVLRDAKTTALGRDALKKARPEMMIDW